MSIVNKFDKGNPSDPILEFNPEMLNQKFFRMTILGASYSGKSIFIKYVYKYIYKHYNKVVVFTPNFNADFYEDFIYNVVDKSGKTKLETFKYFTNDFDEVMVMANAIRDSKLEEENILIILDDIISNKATKNNEFLKLFASGRHSNISLIYSIQFMTHEYVNNSLRANSNVIVTTQPSTIQSRGWIKNNLIQNYILSKYPLLTDAQTNKQINDKYSEIFENKYDKAVFYENQLFKTTGEICNIK